MKGTDLKFMGFLLLFLVVALGVTVLTSQEKKQTQSRASYTEVNLVQNSSFEEWVSGLPKFWLGNKDDVRKVTDFSEGQYALELKGEPPLPPQVNEQLKNVKRPAIFNDGAGSGLLENIEWPEIKGLKAVVSQNILGLLEDSDYAVSFKTKGGRGEVILSYTYVNQNTAGKTKSRSVKRSFGPNTAYSPVAFNVHTEKGLKNGTAKLRLTALQGQTVLLDDVKVVGVSQTGSPTLTPTPTVSPTPTTAQAPTTRPIVTLEKTVEADQTVTLDVSWVAPLRHRENLKRYEYAVWSQKPQTVLPGRKWPTTVNEEGPEFEDLLPGTKPGREYLVNWTSAGQNTQVAIANLTLKPNTSYFVSVRAVSNANKVWPEGISKAVKK